MTHESLVMFALHVVSWNPHGAHRSKQYTPLAHSVTVRSSSCTMTILKHLTAVKTDVDGANMSFAAGLRARGDPVP